MRKSIMFVAIAMVAGFIMTGCSSVPKFVNLTGTWEYTFVEKGKDEVLKGSMTLNQNGAALSGKANDKFGEFALTGSVDSPTVSIDGKRNDDKRSFKIKATLSSEDEFEGTYTTDQQTSGTMTGKRLQ